MCPSFFEHFPSLQQIAPDKKVDGIKVFQEPKVKTMQQIQSCEVGVNSGGQITCDKHPLSALFSFIIYLFILRWFPTHVRSTQKQLPCMYCAQALLNSSQMAPVAANLRCIVNTRKDQIASELWALTKARRTGRRTDRRTDGKADGQTDGRSTFVLRTPYLLFFFFFFLHSHTPGVLSFSSLIMCLWSAQMNKGWNARLCRRLSGVALTSCGRKTKRQQQQQKPSRQTYKCVMV